MLTRPTRRQLFVCLRDWPWKVYGLLKTEAALKTEVCIFGDFYFFFILLTCFAIMLVFGSITDFTALFIDINPSARFLDLGIEMNSVSCEFVRNLCSLLVEGESIRGDLLSRNSIVLKSIWSYLLELIDSHESPSHELSIFHHLSSASHPPLLLILRMVT